MHENYQSYLASKYWQEIKREVFKKYRCCQICGKGNELEVHHLTYDNLYEENLHLLRLLCHKCHKRQHFTLRGKKIPLKRKQLEKRYKFLKRTYPIRNFRPSTIGRLFLKLYMIH